MTSILILILMVGCYVLGAKLGLPSIKSTNKVDKMNEQIEFLSILEKNDKIEIYWSDSDYASLENYKVDNNDRKSKILTLSQRGYSTFNLNYTDKRFRDVLSDNMDLVHKYENR